MASYNKIIFMGNLARDPEVKAAASTQVAKTALAATKKGYKKKDGSMVADQVCFIDIELWGPLAELASKYLKKGTNIQVEGYLKQQEWKDAQGNSKSKHVIHVENMVMISTSGVGTKDASVRETSLKVDNILVTKDVGLNDVMERVLKPRTATQLNPIDDNELPF